MTIKTNCIIAVEVDERLILLSLAEIAKNERITVGNALDCVVSNFLYASGSRQKILRKGVSTPVVRKRKRT